MKKLLKKLVLFLIVVSFCVIPKAYAVPIMEQLTFDIAAITIPTYNGLYDRGTLYSLTSGNWVPTTSGQETLPNATYVGISETNHVEDTWGIFRVKSIISDVRGTIFLGSDTPGATQIVGMFGNFVDVKISATDVPSQATILSDGGFMQLWMNNNSYQDSVDSGVRGAGGTTFTGITTGTLLIDGTASTRFTTIGGNPFTLDETFNFNTFLGNGGVELNVNPSTSFWAGLDSNLMPDGSDMSFGFSSLPSNKVNWVVQANGQALGFQPVPEPATLLLLGLGLFGVGLARRFRKN